MLHEHDRNIVLFPFAKYYRNVIEPKPGLARRFFICFQSVRLDVDPSVLTFRSIYMSDDLYRTDRLFSCEFAIRYQNTFALSDAHSLMLSSK